MKVSAIMNSKRQHAREPKNPRKELDHSMCAKSSSGVCLHWSCGYETGKRHGREQANFERFIVAVKTVK